MVIVVIVLCVLAVGITFFQILGLIDFINMPGSKKNKSKADDNATISNENELTNKE